MKITNNKIKSLFLMSLAGSSLAKGKKDTNHSKIASPSGKKPNLLPKLATNLTEQGNGTDPTLIYAGMPIFLRELSSGIDYPRCVTGFALEYKQLNGQPSCSWGDGFSGFITSGLCCQSHEKGHGMCGGGNDAIVLVKDENDFEQIGYALYASTDDYNYYDPTDPDSVDAVVVDGTMTSIKQGLVPYVMGQGQMYPVMGLGSVSLGDEVCAYGAVSGYLCGELIEINIRISQGGENEDDVNGVNVVDLGSSSAYSWEDLGAPVYTVSNIGDRTVAQALGHISFIDNRDPNHHYVYYTSLYKFLEFWSTWSCQYSLMIYNETNAKEYDQLLAQVEIPPKN